MRNATILLAGLIGFSTVRAEDPGRFEFEEPHMGTKFRIVLHAKDRPTADAAAKEAFARVAELNRIMSDYLPDSELSKLCARSAKTPAGPVPVSADLFKILARADEISRLSDGSFDVTVGPIIKLWRQARKDRRLPDPDVLKEALSRVGYRKMELDPKARTVSLTVAGMQLDLGGIAKGHAADECLKIIAKHGITQALVAASGDIAVSDAPPGKPGWKVAIGRLPGSTTETKHVWLKNAAISTSGDEIQFVEIAGTRYSHIADPKTGLGLTGRRRVTVIARRGIDADSLTKMASILPADKVLPVIDQIEGAATLIVVLTENGEETRKSKGFDRWLANE
jgi:FAD:protein FMN transferase